MYIKCEDRKENSLFKMDLEVLKSTEGLIKASQIGLAFAGCILSFFPLQGYSFWTFVFVTTIMISGILLGLQVGTVQDFLCKCAMDYHIYIWWKYHFFTTYIMSSLDLPNYLSIEPTKIGHIFRK